MSSALERVSRLACWKGSVEPRPLRGGKTNQNFVVEDAGKRYFVRIGDDIPIHGVMRFNELAASRAAAARRHEGELRRARLAEPVPLSPRRRRAARDGIELLWQVAAQTCALGAAMFGAAAAGHASIDALQQRCSRLRDEVVRPDPAAHAVYRELYALYSQLPDAFGSAEGALAHTMKQLIAIRERS